MSVATQERLIYLWETPHTLYGWLSTVDHKKVGKRYLVTAMAFLIIGGLEALIMRLQLATANRNLLTPEMYNQIFTMHGMTMIFWYAAPILSGFANYFVPLLIGARDMAYPRLNAFTYWSFLLRAYFCTLVHSWASPRTAAGLPTCLTRTTNTRLRSVWTSMPCH